MVIPGECYLGVAAAVETRARRYDWSVRRVNVADTDAVEPCATSGEHFYTSDGSDLEAVFEEIGRGIGNLRLTR